MISARRRFRATSAPARASSRSLSVLSLLLEAFAIFISSFAVAIVAVFAPSRSGLSTPLKIADYPSRIDRQGAGDIEELDHVKPPLAALEL